MWWCDTLKILYIFLSLTCLMVHVVEICTFFSHDKDLCSSPACQIKKVHLFLKGTSLVSVVRSVKDDTQLRRAARTTGRQRPRHSTHKLQTHSKGPAVIEMRQISPREDRQTLCAWSPTAFPCKRQKDAILIKQRPVWQAGLLLWERRPYSCGFLATNTLTDLWSSLQALRCPSVGWWNRI